MQLGLGMAYQHLTTVNGLTVAENLYLGAPDRVRPAYRHMYQWATEKLHQYELDVAAAAPIQTLSAAQLQLLEIVSSLLPQPKVLLLDEPTTALGHADVQRLHTLIRNLAANGMGIVYVSHRLPEVLDVANRITVLRDGVSQGTYAAADDVRARRRGDDDRPPARERLPGDRRGTARRGPAAGVEVAGRRFGPIDLELRRGEIVGIAGAEGNGQVRTAAGAGRRRAVARHCHVRRQAGPSQHARRAPIRAGIILLSADRKRESIFTALSVRANATLQVLRKYARLGFVTRKRERKPVNELVDRLRLKAASIEQPTQYLSGGNQQKVALMRPFLRGDLNVILADEPTQGVDVGARLDIYHALRDKAAEGTTVLVKSSDAIELAGICDRVDRHVARPDRRRDPSRRARRAADHRRHHRTGLGARRPAWRVTATTAQPRIRDRARRLRLARWLPHPRHDDPRAAVPKHSSDHH